RPVRAAIGGCAGGFAVEAVAHEVASAGATLLKVGFAGIDSGSRVSALLAAAIRGAAAATEGLCGIIAVAYADPGCDCGIGVPRLLSTAAREGARGVLVDTSDKTGPGLCQLASPLTLSQWVAEAHDLGLTVALAGKLTADDLPIVRDAGADIAGVRGAAGDDGRPAPVSAERIQRLQLACASAHEA